ncbi:hypothetical protein V5N11_014979 [Cardamine amara subsp. amara]|uniref:Glycine-rich protein n=1 Tax=Cardamine amara subsp. amara TaxID=228776 RepID=A0ABD1A5E1_CARAN
MGFRRTSLVLYILLIFHLQHNFHSVSSRPSSVDTNHETLPISASKPDIVGFEGKARELVVVIKKGGRGGGRSRGGGGGGSSGRSRSRVIPVRSGGGGSAGSHRSSGNSDSRGAACAVGWLALSVIAGLFLVQ